MNQYINGAEGRGAREKMLARINTAERVLLCWPAKSYFMLETKTTYQ